MTKAPDTTVRSELQSIGRTIHPTLGQEAVAQRLQTRMPWVWMMVGLLLMVGFIAALMVAGPSRLASMPKQSAIFSAPERHR